MEPNFVNRKKSPIGAINEKQLNNSLERIKWNNYISLQKLLNIKDTGIKIIDVVNRDTHNKIIAKLDYDSPAHSDCRNKMKKSDFLSFFSLKRLVDLAESF